MQRSSCRPVRQVDADLRVLWTAERNARVELEEVRRRQRELAQMEAELVVAGELRARRVDILLEERLLAAGPPGEVPVGVAWPGPRAAVVDGGPADVVRAGERRLPAPSSIADAGGWRAADRGGRS